MSASGLHYGMQEAFGMSINVHPVQTMTALCYKLEFKQILYHGQGLTISSPNNLGVNSLEGINWHITANNTWQGIIQGHWPYENIPLPRAAQRQGGGADRSALS